MSEPTKATATVHVCTFEDMFRECFADCLKMTDREWTELLVELGIVPSNNWLKMHGYPMRRKK